MMERPIIVIGSGRSGSTAFARVLANHGRLVYMSQLTSKLPRLLFLSRFYLRLTQLPIVGSSLRRVFKMAEAYSLWNIMAENFARPRRNIDGNDVLAGDDETIRKTLDKLSVKKNSRLLIKITGWPRIGYLLKVFPDAVFINVIRDGRAVANSLMNSDFWWGRKGPVGWRLGPLPEDQEKIYEKHGRSLTALAGIYWNILMEATEDDINRFKPSLINVRYEDFCSNKIELMKKVCDFCNLDWNARFEREVTLKRLENNNFKWQTELDEKDRAILNDVTLDWRKKLGYL